jgi:hypothetical protein
MKQPSNPAAEAIEKLNAQNAELLNLRIQTEQGNKDYCDRLNAEIASNESIIAMLEPNAEWTEEQPTV